MNTYFANKVVVISGGNGGLGQALTQKLLTFNAKVVCLDLHINEAVTNINLLQLSCDVTNIAQVNEAVKSIMEHFGRVDMLINNAGITHLSKVVDTDLELFNKVLHVNLFGSVNLTKSLLSEIIKNQGHITAISSVAGFAPLYGRAAYAASKHGMEGYFRSLEAEISEYGTKVSIICPSFVNSRPEITAQVNQGAISPGAAKKQTNGEAIAPERAAESILSAMAIQQRTLLLGKVSKAAFWLSRLLPRLYLKVMTNGAKKEFE